MLSRNAKKKIGELLIERGLITPEQLKLVLAEQKKKGGYISQYLINMGVVTDVDVAMCLSEQYNFPYLSLKNYTISAEILGSIPLKWIKIYTLIPVNKTGNILSVAMADPLNEGVIQMLQQITSCEIQVFISTYSEIDDAINKYYGEKLKDLREGYLDAQDLGKIKTAIEFIQTAGYSGRERREYARVSKELDISFYYQGKEVWGKIKDISYGGVSFTSETFMPLDTNLACKVYLEKDGPPINVVVNILRVQTKEKQGKARKLYEIAGYFGFISREDRIVLVPFLQKNIT
ncbi:MAG: PilZ domain-containing protein [Candidatus Omnitrophota bacterium]|jgi:hypothetical protein